MRFAATKLVEGDRRIEEALKLDQNEKEMIEHIIVQMEQERGLDRAAAIADMRFSFIQELVAKTVVKPHESKAAALNRIDKFLTGKYTAIPAFIAIMGLVFFLTFNVIGLFFQNLMETGIDAPDRHRGHGAYQLERQCGGALPCSSTASLPAWAAC